MNFIFASLPGAEISQLMMWVYKIFKTHSAHVELQQITDVGVDLNISQNFCFFKFSVFVLLNFCLCYN